MKSFLLVFVGLCLGLLVAGGGYYWVEVSKINSMPLMVMDESEIIDNLSTSIPSGKPDINTDTNHDLFIKKDMSNSLIQDVHSIDISKEWVDYASSMAGISFKHPNRVSCFTRSTTSSHPDWLQTYCSSDTDSDPFVVIDTPYIDSGEYPDTFKLVSNENIEFNGSMYSKKIYHSLRPGFYWGYIVYISGKSEQADSISVSLPFGEKEMAPHKTQESAERDGDTLVSSILR